jgi:hypothetical protein
VHAIGVHDVDVPLDVLVGDVVAERPLERSHEGGQLFLGAPADVDLHGDDDDM